MSRVLPILIELLLLAALSWFCIRVESADIEADLAHRSQAVLGYAGLEQVKVETDGQTIILRGNVESEPQRALAVDSVATLWGVTAVSDQLVVRPPETPDQMPGEKAEMADPPPAPPLPTKDRATDASDACSAELEKFTDGPKIGFTLGSDELSPASRPLLKRLAALLERCGDSRLDIIGHTDSIGDAADNLALSKARAEAVAQALASLGIDPARLHARGKGEREPIADNTTEAGREQNRRIEFRLRHDSTADNLSR